MGRARPVATAVAVVLLAVLGGCSTSSSGSTNTSGKVPVVAAEDVWGSIARQLGGEHADVTSVITSPNTDPHDYEPTPTDARAVASARLVVVNGIGYDPWADKLLSANPVSGRQVVKVGDVAGLRDGDNPHQWYSPAVVDEVIAAINARYKQLDQAHAAYFDEQRARVETTELRAYRSAVGAIRRTYAGTPVGASESIFAPMASALGLQLVTPGSFLDAISEGNDPTAADKATVDRQIATKAIKVFVFNSQNATPDVQRLVDEARARRIPVTTVTETLTPKGATFQDWQTRQLEALRAALATATGR